MTAVSQIESMIETLQTAMKDAEKVDKGQNAAGTRLRKAMQVNIAASKDLRKWVLAQRN